MTRSADYIGAVGIAVSDLARSTDFYTRVMGMKQTQAFSLPDMEEVIVAFEGRAAALALMRYTDGSARIAADKSVKLVFFVTDPTAAAARIRAEGLEVTREPAPVPALDNAMIGFAKDPDGYLIELLQAPAPVERRDTA